MIYTITLNPAVDYYVHASTFECGNINRSYNEKMLCGGKGINVSTVLKNFGMKSCVMGFVAGETGKFVEKYLHDNGYLTDLVNLSGGMTRINVKIKDVTNKQESAINGSGPVVTDEELSQLFYKLEQLNDNDILVISGSVPSNLSNDIYLKICEIVEKKDVYVIIDAEKHLLIPALQKKPYLIKPNKQELEQIFDVTIKKEEVVNYIYKLQDMGARNVLVSLGEDGAILVDEQKNAYFANAIGGKAINSVGAGDTMVAEFVYNLGLSLSEGEKNLDFAKILENCVKMATATAMSDGLVDVEIYDKMFKN